MTWTWRAWAAPAACRSPAQPFVAPRQTRVQVTVATDPPATSQSRRYAGLFADLALLHAVVLERLVDGGALQELDQSERNLGISRVPADRRLDDGGHLQLSNHRAQIFQLRVGDDLAQRVDVDFISPGSKRHLPSHLAGIVNLVADLERGQDFPDGHQCRAGRTVFD